MQYLEAPDDTDALHPSAFLAGGITNCPDWQSVTLSHLRARARKPITVYNPRRERFDVTDPTQDEIQIPWEFTRLHTADVLAFWFSEGSINPIVLFEYGGALERMQRIVLGVSPRYERRRDVLIQTRLRRPNLVPVHDLEHFADGILNTLNAA